MKNPKLKFVILSIFSVLFYSALILISDLERFSHVWSVIILEYIPIILGLHFFAHVIRTFRQKLFFKKLDISLSFRNNFLLYFSGASLIMTPGGVGELLKSYLLKINYGHSISKTSSVILAEKYHNILSGVSLILILLLIQSIFEVLILTLILGVIILMAYIAVKKINIFLSLISKLPKKWILTPLIDNSPTFCNSLNSLFHNRVFFTGLLFGISASLLDGLAFFIGFLAFGLDTSFIESATFVMSSLTLGSLSFLPAGIGVTEISLLGFLTNHGVFLATASALILFIRLSTSWYTTIIGIISLKIFLRTKTNIQS